MSEIADGADMDTLHDPRWGQLAELLVHYSTRVRAGERVVIALAEPSSYPLAVALYAETVRAGGLPQMQLQSEYGRDAILRLGSADQLAWVPELEESALRWADVYLGLRGGYPLSIHDGVPDERMAINQQAHGAISTLRWGQTRWALVRTPDQHLAAQAGLDLQQCREMFFDACLVDWEAVALMQQRWADALGRHDQIRITGTDTDLTFSVAGRRWVSSAGLINMPDGEVFTAPVTGTEHGTISFEYPAVLSGRTVEGIRLTWEHGRLRDIRAQTNQDFLIRMATSDAGAGSIGEFAIGTNTGLTRFCTDVLLDEKIAGTCHIALGRAYPECGGTNQSALHWDIVKDLRQHGSVEADGQAVVAGGVVVL